MKRIVSQIGLMLVLGGGCYLAYAVSQSDTNELLFNRAAWVIPIALFLGIFTGAMIGREEPKFVNGKVLRHSWGSSLYHLSWALSGILLIVTGIYVGFFFIPRLVDNPQAVAFMYNLHFIAILVFLFGISAHLTEMYVTSKFKEHMPESRDVGDAVAHYASKLGGGKKPREGKYLASEKISYPVWMVIIGLVALTGFIKVVAHIWNIPAGVMGVSTFIHDLAALAIVALLIVHLVLGVLAPWSWYLLRSLLTGFVSEGDVKKYHPKWYDELTGREKTQ
ncbi:cytochrome b/b6 domain-containing protein [Chloroflexota bacterium]